MKKPTHSQLHTASIKPVAPPLPTRPQPDDDTPAPDDTPAATEQGITVTLQSADANLNFPESRLSLQIPLDLHKAMKLSCLQRGVSLKDDVTTLLKQVYLPKAN